jgi:hypothetical protein
VRWRGSQRRPANAVERRPAGAEAPPWPTGAVDRRPEEAGGRGGEEAGGHWQRGGATSSGRAASMADGEAPVGEAPRRREGGSTAARQWRTRPEAAGEGAGNSCGAGEARRGWAWGVDRDVAGGDKGGGWISK